MLFVTKTFRCIVQPARFATVEYVFLQNGILEWLHCGRACVPEM